jgi:hypothetical protein
MEAICLRNVGKLLPNYMASQPRREPQMSRGPYQSEYLIFIQNYCTENTGMFAVLEKLWYMKRHRMCYQSLAHRKGVCSVCVILGRRTMNRVEYGSYCTFEAPHIYDNGFLRLDELLAVLRSIYRTPQPILKVHSAWKLGVSHVGSIGMWLYVTSRQALGSQWNENILDDWRKAGDSNLNFAYFILMGRAGIAQSV